MSDSDRAPARQGAEGSQDSTRSAEDVVFVGGPVADGAGVRVLRKREGTLEVGEMRPVQEGKPIHGELVRLQQREEHERLFDVEVVASQKELGGKASSPRPTHAGPAQVATQAYRTNWDAIFGGRDPKQLN